MMCMNHVLMNVGGVHVNKRLGKSPAFSVSINSRIITILVLRVLPLACDNFGGNHPVWKFL